MQPEIIEQALLQAARKGSLEEVERLVRTGVNVNCSVKKVKRRALKWYSIPTWRFTHELHGR